MPLDFYQLDQRLENYQSLWRYEAFHCRLGESLAWQKQYPELSAWIEQLQPEEIAHYKSDLADLYAQVASFFPNQELDWLAPDLMKVEPTSYPALTLPRGIDTGIPGRKQAQILAMGSAVIHQHQGKEWLEWCAGKGFLGRILASQSQQTVTSFEFQATLCTSGQREADYLALPMSFIQGDAFSAEADAIFHDQQHAVALHACGDLHTTLLQKVVQFGLPAVTISPCCYHLIRDETYQPISQIGQRSQLALTQQELRIPLQETVTGGERVKRHRFQEMSYRLGFDQLLLAELGLSKYQPLPSVKKSMLSEGFAAFCHWGAEQKQLILPQNDITTYQQLGEKRFWRMERLSLLQDLFRRPLELWLAMDRVHYLREQGYTVALSEFCARETTPRNLLIHAELNQ